MINRFLVLQSRFVLVLLLLSVFVSGCIFLDPPNCAAELEEANIYKKDRLELVSGIYETAYPPTITPQPANTPDPVNTPPPDPLGTPTNIPPPSQIESARYAAFKRLAWEAERWSAIKPINFNDGSQAQLIITFISPELLQAVFLDNSLNPGTSVSDFHTQARTAINSIAIREELLFLLTIVSPSNRTLLNNHIIKFDTKTLVLKNAEGLELEPFHIESNLGQPINPSAEPVFGHFGYPLVKEVNGQCKLALDSRYNTNIVITLPVIEVDGIPTGPYSWTIAYAPLMDVDALPPTPNFSIPPGYPQSQMSPTQMPPSTITQASHWEDFARFLWYKITLGN